MTDRLSARRRQLPTPTRIQVLMLPVARLKGELDRGIHAPYRTACARTLVEYASVNSPPEYARHQYDAHLYCYWGHALSALRLAVCVARVGDVRCLALVADSASPASSLGSDP